jgi:ligand-binding sensor domain-containing protein/signal transduction histidine kinase
MWKSMTLWAAGSFALLLPVLMAEQLPIQTYTAAEGLAHNHINRIRQDTRGFLWFCTDGGLTRFDGRDFASYTTQDGIPHPWVNDFLEAHDGTYWVATDGGVVKFNPAGTSQRLSDRHPRDPSATPMFVAVGPEGPAASRRVNALAEDTDGSILFATYAGLYRLRRSRGGLSFHDIEIGLPKGMMEGGLVNNLSPSRLGGWWIAARYGLFHLSTEGRSTRITSAQGLPDNFVETAYEDRSGGLWVGTRTGGFCEVRQTPTSGGRIGEHCYSVRDGLPSNDVRSILQLADGAFWIGTAAGLSEFYPYSHGPWFRNYTVANGLTDSHILKLAEDSNGNLWIGTALSGVMKMVRQGFSSFDSRDGFLSGMNHESIFETAGGELSIVSEVGGKIIVQVLNGGRFHRVDPNLPMVRRGNPVRSGSLEDHAGDWWIGTDHGLFHFSRVAHSSELAHTRAKAVYTAANGFAGDNVDALYEDSNGDIWISTNSVSAHSLSRWSRSSGILEDYTEASPLLRRKRASAFGEDASGNIWIGLIDDGGIVRQRHGQFEPLAAPPGTFSGIVRAIYADPNGRMWVATNQAGLTRIDRADLDEPRVKRYSEAEGLSSNDVSCITEDESGQIYAGTNRGVDRLDPASGSIRPFTVGDGLVRGAILLAHRDRAGVLWFVANSGVSRLIPPQTRPPSVPRVLIRRLRISGVPYPISEVGETALRGIEIPPERNAIQIEFAASDFQSGSPLQYQYRLEGTSLEWGRLSGERSVQFASLTPGDYRFLVRAVVSNATGASTVVSFHVVPPFWRRWWFLTAMGMLAASALYVLHWMRLQRAMEIERVRTRIATDLHDDIGSSLSQIAILSEVVNQSLGGQDSPEKEQLGKIAGTSRDLIHSLSDIVWAINPEKDHFRDLMQRMRRFASDVFTARHVDFRFNGPGTELDIGVGADVRRQVFLIFKESVNNAVKHSGCTRVDIDFVVEKHWLVLRLRDNGNGLKLSECGVGQGLASMRARAESLGGMFAVRSGQGTEIALRIPLGRLPRKRRVKGDYPNGQ